MEQLYRKRPMHFALVWIGIYCVVQSLANGISAKIGIAKSANAVLALLQSVCLLWWLHRNGLMQAFQLNRPRCPAKKMLFYLPLLLVSTSNLWMGVTRIPAPVELAIHVLLMLNVGFLEELIFRGFLFEALRKTGLKTAVLVSSLTFGLGHIGNLVNGSGMPLWNVLFQILFAVLFGFLFVMVYLHSGSLIPCILAHQTVNVLSAFANPGVSGQNSLVIRLTELGVIALYLLILSKTAPLPESEP